jgi:hypothetical protein
MRMQALLDHHSRLCRHTNHALLQQVMQGQPFLCFLADSQRQQQQQQQQGTSDWLAAAEQVLCECRQAEEQLQQHRSGWQLPGGADAASGGLRGCAALLSQS